MFYNYRLNYLMYNFKKICKTRIKQVDNSKIEY